MRKIKVSARINADSPLFYEENMSEVIRTALERYYHGAAGQKERREKDGRTRDERV
ncbi:hypothetical protein SAMN02746089_02706 [Caldanaerobius fijiensis DSM 17918]|uniref:Uncharacterized protein n=1 Tax=Caldanaerobius fijiensis DSM 17918 TaxID=1121256 RepID=A0A1M5F8R9_9THEO|nr:hypothetical protein [Caldanaerobius fijiensis]SHF87876.1 hypothetical protein SAMN02746089_02706 [Caldanaerobius fijiensis DSM 17918]